MKISTFALQFAASVGLIFSAQTASFAAPPVEAFGALPTIDDARISPTGKYIALMANSNDVSAVPIIDAVTKKVAGGARVPAKAKPRAIQWYSDDRLLVFVNVTVDYGSGGVGDIYDYCRIISTSRDGSQSIVLLQKEDNSSLRLGACNVITLAGPEPDTVLLGAYSFSAQGTGTRIGNKGAVDVYKVNVVTGNSAVYERGNPNTREWIADANGKIRLRVDSSGRDQQVFARLQGSDEWTKVYEGPYIDFDAGPDAPKGLSFLGFGTEPDLVYVSTTSGDRAEMATFDLRAKKLVQTVASDPIYDVGSPIRLRNRRIIGASVVREVPEREYFPADWRNLKRTVADSYPGERVSVISASDDLTKFTLYVEGPQTPGGQFQYLDMTASEASIVGNSYPGVTPGSTGKPTYLSYAARDGKLIPAYLTLPPGKPAKNLPLIVMPHGGPASRDAGSFDWFSQFLVSRGYAVLQPQFRGSTGFGNAFAKAGEREWGGKMQHDVSDGVKYVTGQGIADPNRVCILGWSYGGYAAMAGATLTPELYRCSVAGAGVSDLMKILRDERRTNSWVAVSYWINHIGNPNKEADRINAVSPINFVDKVRAPMLLIHGANDTVVPISQSEVMADALKAAGKPFEFVRLGGEDHYMSFGKTRIETLKAMESFLLKHNPPN